MAALTTADDEPWSLQAVENVCEPRWPSARDDRAPAIMMTAPAMTAHPRWHPRLREPAPRNRSNYPGAHGEEFRERCEVS